MKMISLFCIIVIIAINAESSRLLLADSCVTTGCGFNTCFQCNPKSGKCKEEQNCCLNNDGCKGNKICINRKCSNAPNPDNCPYQPKCKDPCTDYSTDQPTPKCNGDGQTCVTVLETDPQTGCPICDVFVGCGGTCGTNTCNNGDVCCNALCSICTPPGMNCIMGCP
eukprot:48925_1